MCQCARKEVGDEFENVLVNDGPKNRGSLILADVAKSIPNHAYQVEGNIMYVPTASLSREKQQTIHFLYYILSIVLTLFFMYYLMLPWHSGDADVWFVPWVNYIIGHGAVESLGKALPAVIVEGTANPTGGNYAAPYLYLLVLGSLGHSVFSSFTIVKLISIIGTLSCAAFLYYLLRTFVGSRVALLSAAGMMILPTVALNAAAWGQSDAIYSGFILLAVAAALRDKSVLMMVGFGLALSFKFQAMFLAPFILYMLISRRWPLWIAGIPALVYAGAMFPAWLAGRPALELAMIYFEQAQVWRWLSMNVPNPWAYVQFLKLVSYEVGLVIGLVLGAVCSLGIAALGFRWRLEGRNLLLLALLSTILLPFVLPKMADRYFFPADVLAFALAIAMPRRWTILCAAAVELGSLGAYASHLWGFRICNFIGALAIGCAVLIIALQLLKVLRETQPTMMGGLQRRRAEVLIS